jgi:hypothetical protein
MDVITFPEWRAYFYVGPDGQNVITAWLDEMEAPEVERYALQTLIDLLEAGGPGLLGGCIIGHGSGLFSLCSRRAGGTNLCPVFCYGPHGDTEITFLTRARMDGKRLSPRYAAGIAEENFENLLADPRRRRRESII